MDQIMSDQINSSTFNNYKLKKSDIVKMVCNGGSQSFLNEHTGAGSVVSNCKHYSHISCLRKYYIEKTTQEGQYNA